MSLTRHTILNVLDTPLKILFWTKGEIALYVAPIFLGLILDGLLIGSLGTLMAIMGNRQFKRRFGQGQLQSVFYWYLGSLSLEEVPASTIRTMVP